MASDLRARIQADVNVARKARDKFRTLVLSTLLSDVRNREIDARADIDDEALIEVVSRSIKQRKDASEQMRAAGRGELADHEDAQAAVLAEYLPEGLSEDEVRAITREIISAGVDQIGPLMGQVMPRIKGRFDGKEANRIVREELAG
ncbi:MAG: GatB/YqeY domain-containing protein [Gemmatimonadetes bacterium]|nr:GatB/YqeY domain-containing protein [Gemmatimonadota bacterium]MDA1104256.1 GatB/YqeY domain-containing protein [Gemmatimonadota bacterium]